MPDKRVRTSHGLFNVSIEDDNSIDISTRELIRSGFRIGVGGRNKCVYITAPLTGDTGTLHNIKTKDQGCELTGKKIAGESTLEMIKLAFRVVLDIAPHIQYLQLQDTSSIPCVIDNPERPVGISLAYYELMFHRSTWYEKHFGARLINPKFQELYMSSKQNFDSPKPTYFSLANKDLNILLQPLYRSTHTWGEFFDELYKIKYKCKLIFPWYKNAIALLCDNISYEAQYWIIDITRYSSFSYTEVATEGGSRRRRKTRRAIQYFMGGSDESINSNERTADEIYDIPYAASDMETSADF
jgi:hypothetical protein